MIPNKNEIYLMDMTNKQHDRYYELSELAFDLYKSLVETLGPDRNTVICSQGTKRAKDILERCEEYEPNWLIVDK